jgi:voltage-gated sodium channel
MQAITTVRLIRVLRVLRLVRALPKLRVLVSGLAQALSSIGYIGLLLGLLYYFFSVLSVSLYAKNDPVGMGTLHVAFVTLFQAGTLEDWTDIMYTQSEGCAIYGYAFRRDQCVWTDPQPFLSSMFFVVFIVLANLLVLNLFIGGTYSPPSSMRGFHSFMLPCIPGCCLILNQPPPCLLLQSFSSP